MVSDMSEGLLNTKDASLFTNLIWQVAFSTHIYFGGIALLCGWIQFLKSVRSKHLGFHRLIGKIYVISIILSGTGGFIISYYATGGTITGVGFASLALLWITTTILGYLKVKQKNWKAHQNWMIRSYSLTFAAVTLRLWMPIIMILFGLEFMATYKIVAWLSWIPNLILTEFFIKKISRKVYKNKKANPKELAFTIVFISLLHIRIIKLRFLKKLCCYSSINESFVFH